MHSFISEGSQPATRFPPR